MQPTKNDVRTVGLLYLSMLPVAPFALIYIPQRLIVRGNPAETASRILGSEMLFRLGIVGLRLVLHQVHAAPDRLFGHAPELERRRRIFPQVCTNAPPLPVEHDGIACLIILSRQLQDLKQQRAIRISMQTPKHTAAASPWILLDLKLQFVAACLG